MNSSDDDIRWIAQQQPEIDLPDPEVSSRARAAVMAHATGSARPGVMVAPAPARPHRRRTTAFARPRRIVAMAAGVAIVAAAGVTATLAVSHHAGNNGIESAIAPGVANAHTLVLLANHVAASPIKGDATLVFHSNVAANEQPFTGADLYLDNGRYYYAPTPKGLPAAAKAGPQDYTLKPIIDAMAATSNADPRAARAAFLKAADPEWGGHLQRASSALQDNVIWVSGIDVLGAAYGRPPVLAGMLRALSTVRGVSVTHARYHGVATLEIAMKVAAQTISPKAQKHALDSKMKRLTRAQAATQRKLAGKPGSKPITVPTHFTRATVNAHTGALLRYTDIGLVVTYHVSRVNAAHYGAR
jgi:hypothetical protein